MKHATPATLEKLLPLLQQIRDRVPPLKEKGTGKFYHKSSAFLHFHEDPTGIFADLKVNGDWQRYPVHHEPDDGVCEASEVPMMADNPGAYAKSGPPPSKEFRYAMLLSAIDQQLSVASSS